MKIRYLNIFTEEKGDCMNKKKAMINFLLLIILIVLIVCICIFYKIYDENRKKEENENVTLTEIGYGSDIKKFGHDSENGILKNLITGYNEHNGTRVVSMMDLVAKYIYNLAENENVDFDQKYVEILSNPNAYKDLYVMQFSVKQEEDGLVSFINDTNVELTLVENTKIQDVSKYLSKFTAKIRTVSADEGIDQVDTLEFLLSHKDKAYYIIEYYPIDENGNKIDMTNTEE